MSENTPPFYPENSPLRPRPVPPPRYMRRKWRYRGGVIIGGAVFLLALLTLYLGAPENYFDDSVSEVVVAPKEIIKEDLIQEDLPQETEIPPQGILSDTNPLPAPIPDQMPNQMTSQITGYFVQLAAERSEPLARRHFETLQRDYAELLRAMSPAIRRADLGERGIFYRLYVGPFSNKLAADDLCTALKQRGKDCLVRKL